MNERAEGLIEGLGIARYLAMKNKSQPKRLLNELANITLRIQVIVAKERMDRLPAEVL